MDTRVVLAVCGVFVGLASGLPAAAAPAPRTVEYSYVGGSPVTDSVIVAGKPVSLALPSLFIGGQQFFGASLRPTAQESKIRIRLTDDVASAVHVRFVQTRPDGTQALLADTCVSRASSVTVSVALPGKDVDARIGGLGCDGVATRGVLKAEFLRPEPPVVPQAAGSTPTTGGPKPTGDPSHYQLQSPTSDARTGKQMVTRWNPCRTIHYKINPGKLGATGIAEVRGGISRLASATGLTFGYDGTTTYVPHGTPVSSGGHTYYFADYDDQRAHTHTDIVIAWTLKNGSNLYSNESGQGGTASRSSDRMTAQITDAEVLLRSDAGLPAGYGPGLHRGGIILHELGHAVGLAHYQDTIMIMNPYLNRSSPPGYNNGDITGLHKVGKPAGCIR